MRYRLTVLGKEGAPVYTMETTAATDAECVAWFSKKTNDVPWKIVGSDSIRELFIEPGEGL